MDRKVYVTGMGMITSLGYDLNTTWENLKAGKSGIDTIKRIDPSALETQIAAEVGSGFEDYLTTKVSKRQRKQMTTATRMSMAASFQAIDQSRIDFTTCDSNRVGVIMGVINTSDNTEIEDLTNHHIVKGMPSAPASWLSIINGLKGPSFNISTACASSAYAIATACQFIKSGICDIVIAGGTGSCVTSVQINGFNQIMAMSVNNDDPAGACRPFSKSRDGFILGEGAGTLILESEESAKARNAHIYAELSGFAMTEEAVDITAPEADGKGMARCMSLALENSGYTPDQVDYINAHGTSTYLNDKYETMAIENVFGDKARKIPVSSSKSMIGHTLGACGAIESIITIMTINTGIITPTINYNDPDPELQLDYVPNVCRNSEVNVAITNSFGFGGHDATLVFNKHI
ncbi:MAG: beta-ketoacyl-[acyl-carrier-protein] synthase family protein [Oscillospiraceae bacterium]|nr:beta-ketoacyl-[acyl-carrier-protein] synthase family protein [Oscillospiraceae bacterium]